MTTIPDRSNPRPPDLPTSPRGILGESTVFNCFFFLYVAARGSGMLSLDALWRKPRPAADRRDATGARVAAVN